MKKFRFSLEKLADYKEQLLKREKNELSRLRAEEKDILDEIDRLYERLEISGREFEDRTRSGISSNEMVIFNRYHTGLHELIEEKQKELENKRKEIQKQTQVVVELSMDVNAMDKLREKQLEEYNAMVAKADEAFIAEFVSRAKYSSQ